jgi:S-adenosylmethionine:tRNA ribosyltransferase-isomerase
MSSGSDAGEDLRDLVPAAPEELIARWPAQPRDSARMLVLRRDAATCEDAGVRDLPVLLDPGDVVIVNDTRVVPARLVLERIATGGRVEALLAEPIAVTDRRAVAMLRTRGTLHAGEELRLPDSDHRVRIVSEPARGRATVETCDPATPLAELVATHGDMPLPPYVLRARRNLGDDEGGDDASSYQTVFAEAPGAVAAPTAGFHFTPTLLDALRERGIEIVPITLHVGPGTFLPIRCQDPREHPMESERASISASAAAALAAARERRARILAVGTTSVRTLETAIRAGDGVIESGELEASIFIHPPFEFRAVDAMLTNFHLPDSTPCLLVAALCGSALLRRAYEHAIAASYRFYSYGDAMLVL